MSGWMTSSRHAASVMNLVERFPQVPSEVERPVAFSWLRCCSEFQLRPDQQRSAQVLENGTLREAQERIDDVVSIARAEMDALYDLPFVRSAHWASIRPTWAGFSAPQLPWRVFSALSLAGGWPISFSNADPKVAFG